MKLGIVFIAIGGLSFVALITGVTLGLMMQDYFSACWFGASALVTGILFLRKGVGRIKRGQLDNG